MDVDDNNCPKGWSRLDCHCYIYQPVARDLPDAENVCNILGGNVVSIHSALENAFVHELFREDRSSDDDDTLWIGLNDAIEADTFVWIDGSEFDFNGFDTGDSEPVTSSDACVTLAEDDGLWNVEDCSEEYPYICITEVLTHSH
nr:ladderlectin-like [Nerophis lumbriciformis]